MRSTRLLLLIVTAALFSAAAWADGVGDPKPITQGCGRTGQPPCDAYVLGPGSTSLNLSFTFLSVADPTNPYGLGGEGYEAGFVDVINDTGKALKQFSISFSAAGLEFAGCGTNPLEGATGAFNCLDEGNGTFLFSGMSLCSTNKDDWSGAVGKSKYKSDHDKDDKCQWGERIGLLADSTGNDPITPGTTAQGVLTTPEPASGLLMILGFAAGTLRFLKRRQSTIA